jgi:hypothetical protein
VVIGDDDADHGPAFRLLPGSPAGFTAGCTASG